MADSRLMKPFMSMNISSGEEYKILPKFVADVSIEKYGCVYCKNILRPPVIQFFCGHRVCGHDCVGNMRESGLVHCPAQEDEDCMEVNIRDDNNLLPDISISRELIKFIVYCRNKDFGCSLELPWSKLEEHLTVCTYALVECKNNFRGCDVKLPREQMDSHEEHQCMYDYIQCEQCNENILKIHFTDHQKDCLSKQLQCLFFDKGCQFVGSTLEDLEKHKVENIPTHLALLQTECEKMKDDIHSIQPEIHSIRSFYVEIQRAVVQLLEENKQFKLKSESKLRNLQKLTAKNAEVLVSVQKIEETLQKVALIQQMVSVNESKLVTLETGQMQVGSSRYMTPELLSSCVRVENSMEAQKSRMNDFNLMFQCFETTSFDGILIWKISEYKKRKEEAMSGQVVSLFSQPFYTDKYGYKLCLRLYLNGDGMGKNTHLSIYIVVMKGEYDAILRWPFPHKVSITLMDQDAHRRNVTDAFRPDPTSKSFKRPTSDYNVASGFPLFIGHSQVENPVYLKDDTIFIKAVVDKQ